MAAVARMSPYKFQPAVDLPVPPASVEHEAVRGPQEAQDEVLDLFDECAPRLRRYVGSLGLKAEVTEDIVQEVFLSLFRHLLLGRSRSNLRGWIFQVGHNQALKQRNRATRTQRTEGSWDSTLTDSLVDPGANPEERLAVAERQRRLRAVLRALPERDRRCLYLRSEGLRYREIAKALDISLGSVAKSVARGLARLTNADAG
jgi:RNA polymerase sigma-70 factor, ECF subfamily